MPLLMLRGPARRLFLRSLALGLPRAPIAPSRPDRILVLRPDHLGDLMLTLPALGLLRQAAPGARIGLLVGPWNREAAEHTPWVDEVLTLPFPWFDRQPKGLPWAPYALAHREARQLRAGRWDTALILRPDFWWGALLATLAGIPRRAGYATPESLPFLTQALPLERGRHEAELALRLVRAVLAPETLADKDEREVGGLTLNAEEEAWGLAWRAERGNPHTLIALHPGSGAPVKQWRADRFEVLARRLTEEHEATLVVTGSNEEAPLVASLLEATGPKGYGLVGAPFGHLAAVLKGCRLAVGVDSGVMHVAAALGVPTVRLYGPVDPERFGPWGTPGQHLVVRSSPACVPCNRLDYPPQELALHPCVRAISVDAVLAAARSLLSATTAVR